MLHPFPSVDPTREFAYYAEDSMWVGGVCPLGSKWQLALLHGGRPSSPQFSDSCKMTLAVIQSPPDADPTREYTYYAEDSEAGGAAYSFGFSPQSEALAWTR